MAKIVNGKVTVENTDVFDFDFFLCDIIVQGIKLIKENKNSIPPDVYDECNKDEELAIKTWDSILDKIILGLSVHKEFEELKGSPYDHSKSWLNEKGKFEPKYLSGLTPDNIAQWRLEKEEYKNSCNKMKSEGLMLLAKYFKDLWV